MSAEIVLNPRLSERTTLGLGGAARAEITVREERDLDELPRLIEKHDARPLLLGRGSNILAQSGELDLILVRPANATAPVKVGEDAGEDKGRTLVRAGAGLPLPALLGRTARMGLSGLEGLSGIPGRLGGSMAMNAGSYGVRLSDLAARVRIWTRDDGLVWTDMSDCRTGYRTFAPPKARDWFLVWEVELALVPDDPGAVRARMREVYAKKKATQPVTARTCGCVFKNPEGDSAGLMLDRAGFRGKRLGGMEFSAMHANFLVNRGGGTPEEALELMKSAREAVLRKFDVELETEVVIVP